MRMWRWAFTCASIFLPLVVLHWCFGGSRGDGSLNSRFLALECKHSNVQAFSYRRLSDGDGDGDALNPRLRPCECECECELLMCIVFLVTIITFGCLLMMVRFLWWWFSKPSFVCMLMLIWALTCTLCCSKHSHLLCCGDSSVPVVVVLLTLAYVHADVSIHMCIVAVAKHFLTFGCLWWWFGSGCGGVFNPRLLGCESEYSHLQAFSYLWLSCDDGSVSVVVVL